MRKRDRTGDVVGRLTVKKQGPHLIQHNGRKRITWECQCSCGNTVFVEAGNLKESHSSSCGCLIKEKCSNIGKANLRHGKTNSREWLAWRGAKDRCFNPFAPQYVNYGVRKITMCESWKNSFENFLEHMGVCPPQHSLERLDVNGNYEPGNCIWATAVTQMRNRRCTPKVVWEGQLRLLVDLAEEYKIPYRTIYERVFRQYWSVKTALTKPVRKKK